MFTNFSSYIFDSVAIYLIKLDLFIRLYVSIKKGN